MTRRCLGKQLRDAEVFDMAEDSSDEEDSAADLMSGTPLTPRENISKSLADATTAHSLGSGSQLQCDAWFEDDWSTPTRARVQVSPCSATCALDYGQRQLADAVLSELQIDLQSQVQHAINHMSSWITEEITLARRGFEENVQKVCESSEANGAHVQQKQEELNSKVVQLQVTLDQQMQTFEKFKEDTRNWTRPQTAVLERSRVFPNVTEGSSDTQPSSSVVEARMVAEERKWRLKIAELQGGLNQHNERVEALEKQSSYLMERSNAQDAEMTESISSVHGLQAQVAAARIAAEKGLDSCVQTVQMNSKETRDLASKNAVHDAGITATAAQIQSLKERLGSEARQLAEKFAVLDSNMKNTSIQMHDLKESFGKETRKFDEKGASHDAGMKDAKIQIQSLEEMFVNGASKSAQMNAKHDADFDDITTKLSKLEEMVSKEFKNLSRAVAAHNLSMKDIKESATQICGLESRLCEESRQLAGRVAEQTASIEDNAAQIHRLGVELGNEAKELAKQRSSHKDNIAQIQDMQGAVQSNTDALQGIKTQVSTARKERLAELEVVCHKLENHEAQLISLPSHFRAQLLASKEGLGRAMTELSNDLRLVQTELAEQLPGKASLSDVQKLHTAMQVWVQNAWSAHQETLEHLTQQTAASNKEQGSSIERHEDWMKEVSKWLVQAQERETGLSHIVYRIVEEDYSELTALFQEAMTTPH